MVRLKLNTLKHLKARQNWSRFNVYNMARLQETNTINRTFYQQKFSAKSETRRYHGEHLTERKWNDMFIRSLKGVVSMDPYRFGASDGREVAMGRGSGLDGADAGVDTRRIPFVSGMFAPIERRLDTALFRAMFASSPRQAKSFIVHGRVKVNGKKMQHPSYMLNPGDMFSIDPELVLFATGAAKPSASEAKTKRDALKKQWLATKSPSNDKNNNTATTNTNANDATSTVTDFTAKAMDTTASSAGPSPTSTTPPTDPTITSDEEPIFDDGLLEPEKIYATPWRPRDFLNVFAYIPRYLEVNHNICHAVYLRHPVARPGSCEVPTPFSPETMQLSHAWYLRRR